MIPVSYSPDHLRANFCHQQASVSSRGPTSELYLKSVTFCADSEPECCRYSRIFICVVGLRSAGVNQRPSVPGRSLGHVPKHDVPFPEVSTPLFVLQECFFILLKYMNYFDIYSYQ